MVYKDIAGSVNLLPIRALSFLYWGSPRAEEVSDITTFTRIEQSSQWSLKARLVNHCRKIQTTVGYTFEGTFSVPFNKLDTDTITDKLNEITSRNTAVISENRLVSSYVAVLTLGNKLPPSLSEETFPDVINYTSGYYIVLDSFSLSYDVLQGELRNYLSLTINAELKKRDGKRDPLVYNSPYKAFSSEVILNTY